MKKSKFMRHFFLKFVLIGCFYTVGLLNEQAYGFNRREMYEQTNQILKLSHNQNNYSTYSRMMELYQDMRDRIKSDLELGNINTAIDYELLIEGLVLENYQALQSVLGFNNYHDTTKEFIDEMSRVYTQKLAYALKQNKAAFQTNFEVKKNLEQSDCKMRVNGKELKQNSFIGPAGVPFYIGIYCEQTFEVKKIQAAESQKLYSISFHNLKPIIFHDEPSEMGIPNPYSMKQQKIRNANRLKLINPPSPIQISFGVGVDWYVANNINDDYYRYGPAPYPILLYSSNQFVYKNFEFVLDLGPVVKTNTIDNTVQETEHTLFIRPILLYTDILYKFKDWFVLSGNFGASTFFVGTSTFLKPISFGVKIGLEPKAYFAGHYFVGSDIGITYYFLGSSQNNMLMGISLKLGVDI